MARNGLSAVETREPNDFYDSLEQEAKDIWDDIGASFGYTPEKGKGNLWFARKPGAKAKDAIGPAESLGALRSMVKEFVGNQPVIIEEVLNSDGEGNTFLPGVEEILKTVDIPELRQPALDYHAYKTERVQILAKEIEAKGVLDELMHKYADLLPVDKATKAKYFKVGSPTGSAVIIELLPADKIKSRIEVEE